jgi:YggT family protein
MTYEQRPPAPPEPVDDGSTTVVEPTPVAYSSPPPPASSNVNVSGGGGYVATTTGPGPLYWAKRIVSLLFGILFVLLAIRIVLLLLVANPGNEIVDFVYSVTEPFVAPFRGMFQFDQVVAGDATIDLSAVVALIAWFLIYLLIMAILRIGDRRSYD